MRQNQKKMGKKENEKADIIMVLLTLKKKKSLHVDHVCKLFQVPL